MHFKKHLNTHILIFNAIILYINVCNLNNKLPNTSVNLQSIYNIDNNIGENNILFLESSIDTLDFLKQEQ